MYVRQFLNFHKKKIQTNVKKDNSFTDKSRQFHSCLSVSLLLNYHLQALWDTIDICVHMPRVQLFIITLVHCLNFGPWATSITPPVTSWSCCCSDFFSIFTLIKNILILWPKPNPNGSRHYRILINTTWGCLNTNMTLLLWIRSMSQGQIFWYEIKGFAKRNPYTKYESLTLIKTILLCNPLLF